MKFNQGYALGLAKVLGLNLKKDAFSEQNMKNREHVNNLKEKLIQSFWKQLHSENREVYYTDRNQNNNESSEEIDTSLSIDSTIASTNTPKSKSVLLAKSEMDNADKRPEQNSWYVKNEEFVIPNQNISYKYFVGKGNNAIMVKGLLKNRYWWVPGEAQNESDNRFINFMWT